MESLGEQCPHCRQSLRPPVLGRYGNPVRVLQEQAARLLPMSGRIPQDVAAAALSRITGAVQQTLDNARDDLDGVLRRKSRVLSRLLSGRDTPDGLELISRFNHVQSLMNKATGRLPDLLEADGEPSRRAVLEYVAATLQDAVERLEILMLEAMDPRTSTAPRKDPLPAEYAEGMGSVSDAMGHLIAFMQSPERASLEACIEQLDTAIERLAAHREQVQPWE